MNRINNNEINVDASNLYKGQVIKNYKELCKLLNWEVSAGNTKKKQLRILSEICEYKKEGNKYIIKEIYNNKNIQLDMRGRTNNNKGKFKEYKQFNISKFKWDNIGIYYILNKETKDIYIGSTIAGFRYRFKQHFYGIFKCMKHTYDLLNNGGEFNILYDMTNIIDEELIRMVENEYIQYFKYYTDYNVINRKNEAYSVKNKKRKYKV